MKKIKRENLEPCPICGNVKKHIELHNELGSKLEDDVKLPFAKIVCDKCCQVVAVAHSGEIESQIYSLLYDLVSAKWNKRYTPGFEKK